MGASEVVAVFNAPEHADIVTKPSNQGVGVEFLVNSRVMRRLKSARPSLTTDFRHTPSPTRATHL